MSAHQPPSETDLEPGVVRLRQRLRALRGRYPGLAVSTNVTHIHEDQVVVRASITFADGTSVSAHAAEPSDAGMLDEAIDLAELRAMTRTLDLLGVGDVAAATRRPEPAEPESPKPPPIERDTEEATPPVVRALRQGISRRPASSPEPDVAAPESDLRETPPRETPEPPPTVPAPGTSGPATVAPPPRQASATTADADADAEPNMADYSWTDFWTWARAHNLLAKGQVEQRIGRSIDGLTPQAIRQLLLETGVPLD